MQIVGCVVCGSTLGSLSAVRRRTEYPDGFIEVPFCGIHRGPPKVVA